MGRRRQKKHEEHVNLERWLVSYADFITLLFAFFVVMYAISSVNEGKYRVLSDSLVAAFRAQPKTIVPIELGSPPKTALVDSPVPAVTESIIEMPLPPDQPEAVNDPNLSKITGDISKAMQPLIEDELINIRRDDSYVEIEIKSSLLFESGDAELSLQAEDILSRISRLVIAYPNPIQVEGFTDNVPINTRQFPSNWELSSARAASVVHLFEDEGIDPSRMMAIGYGEYRPVASNETAVGRDKNRRVNVVILGQGDIRQQMLERQRDLKQRDLNNDPLRAIESQF